MYICLWTHVQRKGQYKIVSSSCLQMVHRQKRLFSVLLFSKCLILNMHYLYNWKNVFKEYLSAGPNKQVLDCTLSEVLSLQFRVSILIFQAKQPSNPPLHEDVSVFRLKPSFLFLICFSFLKVEQFYCRTEKYFFSGM